MITKSSIAQIHADIDAALKVVAVKHGLTLKPTRLGYNSSMLKINGVEMVVPTAGGLDPREVECFNLFSKLDGLAMALEGTFTYRGNGYKIVGYVHGRKTPYKTLRVSDDAVVFFPPELIKGCANKSWEK